MKKLLTTIAAVACATVVNAAAFSWSSTGTIHPASDSSAALTSFTAYLIDSSTVSQGELLTALRGGAAVTDYTALSTFSGSTKISSTDFTADVATGTSLSAYFVIVDGDYTYLSKTVSKAAQDVGSASLAFGSQSTSSGSVFGNDVSYSSAGWYSTAAVPEPTSGLLLLLGMAGLALKRKRA